MISLNLFINHFRYKKIVEKNKFIIIFNLIDYSNILFFIVGNSNIYKTFLSFNIPEKNIF